jgi:hypothetical protein
VRRRDEHRVSLEAFDDHPLPVHGLWSDFQSHCVDALVLCGVRWIFNGDARSTARPEHTQQKVDALRCSLHNHDLGRVRDHPARPAEVISECRAQDALASRLAVVERRGA